MKFSKSDLQKLIKAMESKNLSIAQVIDLVNEHSSVQSNSAEEISLAVDYSQTVEQMVAAGKYGWKNPNITEEHFPLPVELTGQKTVVSAKLFHFNRSISSDDAISEMDRAGYRPATLMELLVLGFILPGLQRQFPIVALGSIWLSADGHRYVPCLGVGDGKRGLDLDWFDSVWRACCRFLGVRK
jgi:hypothetical protein